VDWLAAIFQSHRQPMLFDVKYPLTSKNSSPIVPAIESNALSNAHDDQQQTEASATVNGQQIGVGDGL
jgi:hypothetical protein